MGVQTLAFAVSVGALLYSVHFGDSSIVVGVNEPVVTTIGPLAVEKRRVARATEAEVGRFYTTGPDYYDHRNLNLYTLLAGLAFLGLLCNLFMYFSNRSAATTVVMMNATGRRRRRDLDGSDEELVGESWTDILAMLGVALEDSWWHRSDRRNIEPFSIT